MDTELNAAVERRPPWMSAMTAMCIYFGGPEDIQADAWMAKDEKGYIPLILRYHRDHWEPYVTWDNTRLPEAEAKKLAEDCIAHIKGPKK